MGDVIPHAPYLVPGYCIVFSLKAVSQMIDKLSNLENTHGHSVLVGRAPIKALPRASEILMRDINLITIAKNMGDDLPIPITVWHRSIPPRTEWH